MKEVTQEIKDYLLSVGYPNKDKIYYRDVWLWLRKERNIIIYPDYLTLICTIYKHNTPCKDFPFSDPKKAVIEAIEYIVTNKLLK